MCVLFSYYALNIPKAYQQGVRERSANFFNKSFKGCKGKLNRRRSLARRSEKFSSVLVVTIKLEFMLLNQCFVHIKRSGIKQQTLP